MDNPLLDGFYLNEMFVEPLTGAVSGAGLSERLPSKSIEVLLCLARHPRRLVSRDQIFSSVWGQHKVNPETLSHAISSIRHALGDHVDNPVFIQTIPKRGYRLLVEPRFGEATEADRFGTSKAPDPAAIDFWQALVRHGVVQAGVAYLVFGWVLIQVADMTFVNIGLPAWTVPFVTFVVIGGLPVVVMLAWFLEKAEDRVVRDRGEQSGSLLQGLERNYLAVIAAYGVASIAAGIYQYTVGFSVTVVDSAQPSGVEETLIPVEQNSIAVLQLRNIDGSEATRVFSDGLSEDILDRLATLPDLLVSARGDAWSLPSDATSKDVRRRLRVAYFLQGSVRIAGDELRVVARLIDSKTGFHIVSRSFDKKLQDFLAMQKEVTDLIVANLQVALPDDPQLPITLHYDDMDLDAYVLYRLGKDQLNMPKTVETIRGSIDYFNQSLSVDPDFAAAHAGLCTAHIGVYEINHDESDIAIAENSCATALAENARLHVVHSALGKLYLLTGRIANAEAAYLNALHVREQDALAMQGLARVYQRQNRFSEAEQLLVRAIELQPGNWNTINALGNFLFRIGRYEDAAYEYRKVGYLDAENFVALGNLGGALMMAGDFDAAKEAIERSLEIEGNQTIKSNLGIIYYYLGEFDRSVTIHREVVQSSPNSNANWLNLADALYFSGDIDAANGAHRKSAELSKGVLSVNPANVEALYLLAWAQVMSGEDGDASSLIERALTMTPNDPYAHYYDALLKTRLGDLPAATLAIERAVELGYPVVMLAAEPYLEKLQDRKEFQELLASGSNHN